MTTETRFSLGSLWKYGVPILTLGIGFYTSTLVGNANMENKVQQISADITRILEIQQKQDETLQKVLIINEQYSNRITFLEKRVDLLESKLEK